MRRIWHAGDIGSPDIAERLQAFRPLRAVYGNIDGQDLRLRFPEIQRFTIEGADVLMKHIGGYPGRYDPSVRDLLRTNPPTLFISGHSHILKVNMTTGWDCCTSIRGSRKIWLSPGTYLIRFTIENGKFSDLEVIELNK